MTINIQDERININDEIWDKYVNMHPIRTIDALISDINITFTNEKINSKKIETMILEEYNVHSNFGNIIQKAEEII